MRLIFYNFAFYFSSTTLYSKGFFRVKGFFHTEEGSIAGTPEISLPVDLGFSLTGGTGFLQRLEKFLTCLMAIKIIFLQQCTVVFLRFIHRRSLTKMTFI